MYDQPEMTDSLSCRARLECLHDVLQWARGYIRKEGYSELEVKKIELALEEALVNVVRHAYSEEGGCIEVTYRLFSKDRIELVVKDYGKPFNPLRWRDEIDYTTSLHERKEGGLGLPLMRQLMDSIEYRREGKSNLLTLRKKIEGTP